MKSEKLHGHGIPGGRTLFSLPKLRFCAIRLNPLLDSGTDPTPYGLQTSSGALDEAIMTARAIGLALAVTLSGCDNGDPKTGKNPESTPPAAGAGKTPAPAPAPPAAGTEKNPEPTAPNAGAETKARVTLETSHGTIILELDPAKAPLTTGNFLNYVNEGFYDGVIFHRVINNFMIQGGGFAPVEGKGTEKETKAPIRNEGKNGLRNMRGTISMARTDAPDSATSQFFINVADNPSLDPKSAANPQGFSPDGYAVFGKVVEGMDVVDKIKQVDTGVKRLQARDRAGQLAERSMEDVPLQDVVIKKATAGQ